MSLSIYNIKKWSMMLMGRSVLHVHQDIGKHFTKDGLLGYYNNMKEKVLMNTDILENEQIPAFKLEAKEPVHFPVGVFQYAFGAYDLYLETLEERYLAKFHQCAEWAMKMQEKSGSWNNFFYIYPNAPYSAMCQGEGASLLLRAFKMFGDDSYLIAAKKSIDFMLKPIEEGGVTTYKDDEVIFEEYTNQKTVLNGWIFAWWGLYDYVIATNDYGKYRSILDASLASMVKMLPQFSNTYWSIYDLDKKLSSPFYHNLHIAQMQAMYQLTGNLVFNKYAQRWERQQKNIFNKSLAFAVKSVQKILEHS